MKNFVTWFAGGVVVVYLAGLVVLLTQIEVADHTWTRLVYVASGLEAIAFSAAGYLFGKEVHREQAENAERRATETQRRLETASTEAASAKEKGRTLREAIKAKIEKIEKRDAPLYSALGPEKIPAVSVELTELQRLADQLFPA